MVRPCAVPTHRLTQRFLHISIDGLTDRRCTTAELDDSYTLEFPEEGSKLVFKGKSKAYPSAGHTEQPKEYAIDLELFDKVNADSVKKSLTGKSLNIVVQKKGALAL